MKIKLKLDRDLARAITAAAGDAEMDEAETANGFTSEQLERIAEFLTNKDVSAESNGETIDVEIS